MTVTDEIVSTRMAHIVFPEVPVDLKALALCGKKWKATQYGADVPVDLFTCPDCVEEAVALLVEAHHGVTLLTNRLDLISKVVDNTTLDLMGEIPRLLSVIEEGNEYADRQEAKALARFNEALAAETEAEIQAEAKAAKKAKKKAKKKAD